MRATGIFAVITVMVMMVFVSGAAAAAPDVVSPDTAAPSDATAQEIRLSERASAEIEKNWTILVNPVYRARVETIVNRLSPQMERNLPYDIGIIDHKMVNAFALAGGKMYVTTGMLDFVKTDVELAGVIAHEMVHADKKHVIIQSARNNRMTLLAITAAIASKGNAAAMIAANVLQVAVMGAYSIDLEKEADALGIDILARAGYNPVGMLTIQERLKEERLKHPDINPGIYQTHPETDERIAAAEKYLDDHGIPIRRKYALGNLRTSVGETSGDLGTALFIDDTEVWRGRGDEKTRKLFGRIADDFWEHLQLETVPFEVRVESGMDGSNQAFYVGPRKIAAADELPPGTESLRTLRENVQKVLSDARMTHPMANYYK
ncbi:MAG: M48 family metallopeptidase [Synergistaceae bacterium]|jgi:Zn-dependent protease with chaperone function|nr:M48 family metallopeptidase [Synergistaceae bacterium]